MKLKFVVPVLAGLAFAGMPALAQDAPMQKMSSDDMVKHHADMCTNMVAAATGRMASLEVKLKLTAAQKPLFDKWKKVRLDGVKAHADKCADMKMPRHDMTIMDGVKMETMMLETRLADLKTQTPSLEALVNALDKDQQEMLKRAALHAMDGRMGMMHRFFERHDGMRMHRMRDGNPPPPAN